MLQNEQKSDGSGKVSEIKDWEFPRAHREEGV